MNHRHAVVEVGPRQVRGPAGLGGAVATAALDGIDDELALVDDHPFPVRRLWADLMRSVLGPSVDRATVVVPGWWSAARVEVVTEASREAGVEVTVTSRPAALCTVAQGTVVEIAPDCVTVWRNDVVVRSVPRLSADDVTTACSVVKSVSQGGDSHVIIDAPGAQEALAVSIVEQLRRRGIAVAPASPLPGPAAETSAPAIRPAVAPRRTPPPARRLPAVAAGAAVCGVTLLVGFARGIDPVDPAPQQDSPTTLLVEGRVGVRLPALWQVRRIDTGPGSARLQATAPDDPHTALHVTQSVLPLGQSPQAQLDALGESLKAQPPGVFDEFVATDHIAGRAAATYRETRTGHYIRWVIVTDGAVRIAIGCQAAPQRFDTVAAACDTAVRSAHTVY